VCVCVCVVCRYQVGLTGAFRSSAREEYARHVECALRELLEKTIGRWTTGVCVRACVCVCVCVCACVHVCMYVCVCPSC